MRFAIGLLLARVLLAACGSQRSGSGDGGALPNNGRDAKPAADAGLTPQDGGISADGGTRCSGPGDCSGGALCNSCTQRCEVVDGGACVQNVNCNILVAYCDSCVGRCRPVQPLCGSCSDDSQCGEGNRCLTMDGGARGCGRDCAALTCPLGYVCEAEPAGGRQC